LLKDALKVILKRLLDAGVRLLKLNASAKYIYPGLKGLVSVPEMDQDFVIGLEALLEMNYASIAIESISLER
jgi:hypothetical protein